MSSCGGSQVCLFLGSQNRVSNWRNEKKSDTKENVLGLAKITDIYSYENTLLFHIFMRLSTFQGASEALSFTTFISEIERSGQWRAACAVARDRSSIHHLTMQQRRDTSIRLAKASKCHLSQFTIIYEILQVNLTNNWGKNVWKCLLNDADQC